MTTAENKDDAITIVDHNPEWIKLAETEITTLKHIFADQEWVIDIQHIGSTAIPGLAAKPVIDILVGTRSIEEAQLAIKPIEKLGYQFWSDNPSTEKMFFVKGMPPLGRGRTHHIHIVKYDSDSWRARLLFRDYLRDHPEECGEYAELKYKLMQNHTDDREAYTDAKYDYIAHVLKKAGFNEEVRR